MIDLKKTYDAIVVGTAAGGFAAKELTEGGLDVLVLEAGPRLDAAKDFKTHAWPYEMPFRGFDRPGERERSYWNCWTADEYSRNLYVRRPRAPVLDRGRQAFNGCAHALWAASYYTGVVMQSVSATSIFELPTTTAMGTTGL